ncbi:hypothetical protein [Sulfurimonas sp. CS5]|uniref:hypothetical protein n=1 Tax=Sulfurimonas sp. CS5 TaxID=3391145 RepID=UPI0039EC1BC0
MNEVDDKLNFPINIVVYSYSANYIYVEFEYEQRDICEILHDDIPNSEDLLIEWIDNKNNINSISCDQSTIISSETNDLTIENHLKRHKYIATTKDKKYNIYLLPLPDKIEYDNNGFVQKKDFVYEDKKYEFNEVVLPTFNHYRYKNLYNYKEEKGFINAILIEFIVRNAIYNDLLENSFNSELEPLEFETEEEFEIRAIVDFLNQEKKIDNILIKQYGLSYAEITTLGVTFRYSVGSFLDEENVSMLIKNPVTPINEIKLNFELSEKELLDQVVKIKENYEQELLSTFNFEEKLNASYIEQAHKVLNKYKKTFTIRQDSIIKALFTFDYIKANKLNIDFMNQTLDENYEVERTKIKQKYKSLIDKKYIEKMAVQGNPKSIEETEKEISALQREEKRELKIHENDLSKQKYKYRKMKTKYPDSIFYEIATLLNETPGRIKNLHTYIHKFLEKKII